MISGELDLQTTLLVIGAAFALVLLLWLLLRPRRQSLRSETQERVEARVDEPYAVTKERPYMKAATPPPAAGLTVRDTAPPPAPHQPPQPAPLPPPAPPAPPPTPPAATQNPAIPRHDPVPPPPTDEPVEVAQPVATPPLGEFASMAFPPHSVDHPDQLTRMKGVGPKLAALLNHEGFTRYEQLASLSDEEAAALDERLGNFRGRLARDRVIEQARLLASGDTATFEAQFGKLGG